MTQAAPWSSSDQLVGSNRTQVVSRGFVSLYGLPDQIASRTLAIRPSGWVWRPGRRKGIGMRRSGAALSARSTTVGAPPFGSTARRDWTLRDQAWEFGTSTSNVWVGAPPVWA